MAKLSFDSVIGKASYGIGLQMGQQLLESGLEGLLPEELMAGLKDALEGNSPAVPVDELHRALREIHEKAVEAQQRKVQEMAEKSLQFLEDNAKAEGVKVTESGLQYKVLRQGEGEIPSRQNRVRVHYTGKLIDGTEFDSSVRRGQPAEFPVSGVIAGWIEALTMMPVGAKWQLYIPYQLAYGERGSSPSIPPYSTLVFDVELLDIL